MSTPAIWFEGEKPPKYVTGGLPFWTKDEKKKKKHWQEIISATPTGSLLSEKDRRFIYDGRGFLACPIQIPGCEGTIYPIGSEIDHKSPKTFIALVDSFISAMHLRFDAIETAGRTSGVGEPMLVDRELADKWHKFHREHAVMRAVCGSCNRRLKKKG